MNKKLYKETKSEFEFCRRIWEEMQALTKNFKQNRIDKY